MKLTVSSALLLAVVAVGAASASASDAVAVDGDAAAHLRHRKLSGRKHGGHAAHKKTATRNLKKKKNGSKKVAEDGEKNGKNTDQKVKNKTTGGTGNLNLPANANAGTSRTVALGTNRANTFGNPNGKDAVELCKGCNGAERCTGTTNLGGGDCPFAGGAYGISTAMQAVYGCNQDNECKSGCCFGSNFIFGSYQATDGTPVPGRACVDISATSAGDNGCVLRIAGVVIVNTNTTNGL